MEKWIRLCCIIEKCSPVFDGLVQFFMGRLEGGKPLDGEDIRG